MSDPAGRVEYRAARPDEYDAVLDLWTTVFGPGNEAYFRSFLGGDPWRKEPYCQVARADGRIVSAVYLCRRPMRRLGETLFLGRIEAVATLPEYRRRGLSTELLRRIVAVMETEEFAFSSLNTGNHSHYAKHGFYRIPLPKNALALTAAHPIPDADPRVEPLSVDRWLEEAPPVYAAFNATLPVFFERSPDYWNGWLRLRLEKSPGDRRLLLGLRRQGVLEGYLLGNLPEQAGGRAGIAEIAALDPAGLEPLLAGAVRAARLAGAVGLFGPHLASMREVMEPFGEVKVGEGGVMHRRIRATEAVMEELDRRYESGFACWWNHLDGF